MSKRNYRQLIEVVATETSSPEANRPANYRQLIEVLSSVSELKNRKQTLRTLAEVSSSINELKNKPAVYSQALEVIGSAMRFADHLLVPPILLEQFTCFLSVYNRWQAAGKGCIVLAATDAHYGITLTQNDPNIDIVVQFGPRRRVVATVPFTINQKNIFTFQYNRATTELIVRLGGSTVLQEVFDFEEEVFRLRYIFGVMKYGETQNHDLAQILVYRDVLPQISVEQVENYLYCKWVSPGANEENNYCVPA